MSERLVLKNLQVVYGGLREAYGVAGVDNHRFYERIKALYWETGNLLEDMGATPDQILDAPKPRFTLREERDE